MKRLIPLVAAAVALALVIGCQGPGLVSDMPPVGIRATSVCDENPVFIPLGPNEYGRVFEAALRTVGDYGFEFASGDANRYAGTIETLPRVAPGIGLFLKPGSPDLYERLLATTQSYRHRVTVKLQPVQGGGFFVEFIARKELEDVPRPMRSTVGGAVFRSENTAERQTEVIDATFFDTKWIYKGRDAAMEQEFIARFRQSFSLISWTAPSSRADQGQPSIPPP